MENDRGGERDTGIKRERWGEKRRQREREVSWPPREKERCLLQMQLGLLKNQLGPKVMLPTLCNQTPIFSLR